MVELPGLSVLLLGPLCPLEPGNTTITCAKHEATTQALLIMTGQNLYIMNQTDTLYQGCSPPELSSLGDSSGLLHAGLGGK